MSDRPRHWDAGKHIEVGYGTAVHGNTVVDMETSEIIVDRVTSVCMAEGWMVEGEGKTFAT